MKKRLMISALFALALMNCSAKVDTPNIGITPAPTPQSDTTYPEFLFQDIQGTVYGQNWLIQSGVVKPFGTTGQKMIELFSEKPTNPCSPQFIATKSYITYVLPANFTKDDYRTDLSAPSGNNPAVFTNMKAQDQNVMAEKTRVVINDITSQDMHISFYAKGSDSTGSQSEVNGSYIVKFCQ